MSAKKTITVTIDPLGNPKIEANGFQGQGCAEATAGLEKALAGGPGGVTREYKEEWSQTPQQNTVKQGW